MPVEQTNPASAALSDALAWELVLDLDRAGEGPLHQRLTRALRDAVRTGRLGVGVALPPSRALALDLGVSRWTVTEAYAQLVSEGYFEARTGSATRVRWRGPEAADDAARTARPVPRPRYDLAPGLPDLRAFPRRAWTEALRREAAAVPYSELGYRDPEGHPRLRAALDRYLERSRAVSLTGAQLSVTSSATAGVQRTCRALLARGVTSVAVEDPGWTVLHGVVRQCGLQVVPVAVDGQGLRVDLLRRHPDGLRAVLVTPAHQFPTGVVLSPARRRELLDWADEVDGLVLEDDYDAEFRYDRAPVTALQGMRPDRVVLVGSLSKTLSPALGIGWVVARPALLPPVSVETPLPPPPTLDQLAFAHLLESGGYDRHLRAARRRYRTRRDVLVDALHDALPGARVTGAAAGLHLLLHLAPVAGDPPVAAATAVAARAARLGVAVVPMARYRLEVDRDDVLVLGYGDLADREVPAAVTRLAEAVRA